MKIKSEWLCVNDYLKLLGSHAWVNKTLYHSTEWIAAVRDGFGVNIQGMATVDERGGLIALTPFACVRKGPFRLVGAPLSGLYSEFSGPLFTADFLPGEQWEVFRSQHSLVRRNADYVEWGMQGAGTRFTTDWRARFESLGYTYSPRNTIVIDLSKGKDAVWSGMEGRARNMVRKAEKAGLKVTSYLPTQDDIENYYHLLKGTFNRQGRHAPHPLSFFRELGTLAALGIANFVSADLDGRRLAMAIFLSDRKRMLYLSGTSTEEGMRLAANSLVQWHSIGAGISRGLVEYDMGGVGEASIDKFKRSFGGEDQKHHRWVLKKPLFRLIEPAALWAARRKLIQIGGAASG